MHPLVVSPSNHERLLFTHPTGASLLQCQGGIYMDRHTYPCGVHLGMNIGERR